MGRERNLLIDPKKNIKKPGVNTDGVRVLTPREWARLQGFPEEFKIPVSDVQAYRQFGNSVSVPVIYEIAKKVIKELDKKITNKEKK